MLLDLLEKHNRTARWWQHSFSVTLPGWSVIHVARYAVGELTEICVTEDFDNHSIR